MTALLDIKSLRGGYGRTEVLRGVDLEVRAGEMVALLGSNGAGKSTLNKMVCGLCPAWSGTVRFDGQDLSGAHSRDYDFLHGNGRLLLHAYLDGLRDAPYTEKLDMETVYVLENELAEGYRPGEKILALAETPERVVVSRWDANRGKLTPAECSYASGFL